MIENGLKTKEISCDLCVVGGGMAGMCAAISAARAGIKVVLMHERPMLGGNASSEIRMWICGAQGRDNRETGILEEIALENLYRNPTKSYAVWDTVLFDFVRREPNITLLLNCACMDAQARRGVFAHGRNVRIKSVVGYQLTTQTFWRVSAAHFCDSSGDSILAPLCGADFRIGRESAAEFGEDTEVKTADRLTMGMSCLIQGRETAEKIKYILPQKYRPLSKKDFEHREPDVKSDYENFWYLELGGDRDSIADSEAVRDELVELAAGTWDYIKNSGEFGAENYELDFLGFLPGKRESRRYVGEYTLTQRDITDGRVFDDEVAYGGWGLDDHFPGGFYHRGSPNTNRPTPSPYSIPYRALYSKNVDNLFFAGRNISVTHLALSSTRVMGTCSLLGEAVGKAAAVAVRHGCAPHDVYLENLRELQDLLLNEDCFLPHRRREISQLCLGAQLLGDERLRNGCDRAHSLYGSAQPTVISVPLNTELAYSFPTATVDSVHIVFDSDLNRETLAGSDCERGHSMRANRRLDSPQQSMPTTLCREFKLVGQLGEESFCLLHVTDNARRSYHLEIGRHLDKIELVPLASWGGTDEVNIFSFDFSAHSDI